MPSFVSREVNLFDEMHSFVSRDVNLLHEMPSFVSREVTLLDEMPSFVSREVHLLDEMPSFVSREVNLLDEMPSFVSREVKLSAQGRRFRCLALAACSATLHPVIIVFARVPFVGCGEWRPQRNPSMSWAMSRDMAAAGARG